MNKSEAVSAVADRTGLPESTIDNVVKAFVEVVTETLAKGESLTIRRFGRFEPRFRRAMTRTNPRGGDPISVPEQVSAGFSPADALKEELNR